MLGFGALGFRVLGYRTPNALNPEIRNPETRGPEGLLGLGKISQARPPHSLALVSTEGCRNCGIVCQQQRLQVP